MALSVRRERAEDHAAVRAVVVDAFRTADQHAPVGPSGEPCEADLVDDLRHDAGYIPELALVAVQDGEIVGHVAISHGSLDDRPFGGLGPLSVRPDVQRHGVGSALMYAVLGAAEALGEPGVVLLGAPEYYSRFGFVEAETLDIRPPAPWGRHFQALIFTDDPVSGTFRYAAPYEKLG